jgi:hypothetical protein
MGIHLRTYIFTDRERRIIQSFLGGKIGINDRDLSKIRSRIKLFSRLKDDIFLYLEFYDMLWLRTAESSETATT